jgi:hypothetical protein
MVAAPARARRLIPTPIPEIFGIPRRKVIAKNPDPVSGPRQTFCRQEFEVLTETGSTVRFLKIWEGLSGFIRSFDRKASKCVRLKFWPAEELSCVLG